SASSRGSGTFVTPTRASIVPTRVASCTPVKIVNSDVLPVIGRPTMAVLIILLGSSSSPWRASDRHLDLLQDLVQNPLGGFGGTRGQAGALIEHHAVREHRHGQALDVVGQHVAAALDRRQRL